MTETASLTKNPVEKLQEFKPLWELFKEKSDRETAIVDACYLDNLLETIIQKSYIKDPQVKTIFKNDRILHSFYTKINIAYFSGLIQNNVYKDLKTICEIRNKFAHAVMTELDFNNKTIVKLIEKLKLPPDGIPYFSQPKLKFRIVVHIIVTVLIFTEEILTIQPIKHIVDALNSSEGENIKKTIDDTTKILKDLSQLGVKSKKN